MQMCSFWHFLSSVFCLFVCFLDLVYKKSLGDDISSDTSGDFRKALLTLADVREPPEMVECIASTWPDGGATIKSMVKQITLLCCSHCELLRTQ